MYVKGWKSAKITNKSATYISLVELHSTLFLEDRFERNERNLSNKKRIITRYLENQKFSYGEKRIYTKAKLIFRPIDRQNSN